MDDIKSFDFKKVGQETANDKILSEVMECVKRGWMNVSMI